MSSCCIDSRYKNQQAKSLRCRRLTHGAYRVEQTVLCQRLLQTINIALSTSTIATADWRPRPIDASAAATEEQIVVELVLLRRGTPTTNEGGRGTLDGEDDSLVVWSSKDMSAETVIVGLPPEWIALGGLTIRERRGAKQRHAPRCTPLPDHTIAGHPEARMHYS